jgi:hypothetical protein
MPVTPQHKQTPPKPGTASEVKLKLGGAKSQPNSKENIIQAALARAAKPKKAKKKR